MKILVIVSGGREYALAWHFACQFGKIADLPSGGVYANR